jgi:hypothetical protein
MDLYGTTTFPYLCADPPTDPETGEAWPAPDCCATTFGTWDCDPTENPAVTDLATDWRNIVLIVSDDQDYCQYGFMRGVCSKQRDDDAWQSCTSELDCQPVCVRNFKAVNDEWACASTVGTGAGTATRISCDDGTGDSDPADCATAPSLGSCVGSNDIRECSGATGITCAHDQECEVEQTCTAALSVSPPVPFSACLPVIC